MNTHYTGLRPEEEPRANNSRKPGATWSANRVIAVVPLTKNPGSSYSKRGWVCGFCACALFGKDTGRPGRDLDAEGVLLLWFIWYFIRTHTRHPPAGLRPTASFR